MDGDLSRAECLILDVLETGTGTAYSLEELVGCLPELSWSELFQAVDHLSRRGAIQMHRRGFDYLLAASGRASGCAAGF